MAILGFADDVVIINKDAAIAQRQLTMLSDFLAQMGMELSIGKCSTFQICTANKSWYQVDPGLHVRLELVSYASSEKVIRYLGINLRPWTGFDRTTNFDIITGAGNNIAKMELKRHQRLELIRVYLLSRFIHGLVIILPSMEALTNIDDEIRRVIKDIYKLHPSTTNGILHTEMNQGALGLQRMETIARSSQ